MKFSELVTMKLIFLSFLFASFLKCRVGKLHERDEKDGNNNEYYGCSEK